MNRLAAGLLMALVACSSDPAGPADTDPVDDPNGPETPDPDPPPLGEAALRLVTVAEGLQGPLLVTSPAGDPRLFVIEQSGRIRVIDEGTLLPDPYLDLTDQVGCCGERGLLGLAFDPDFAANDRFFVSYTDRNGTSRVESYRAVRGTNGADPTSGQRFLEVAQPFSNHNGGHVAFGPDGLLYIGLGDGGSGGDPLGHGQDRGTLLGTILRVDVGTGPPYAIPPDNPFVSTQGARAEIWHYGLRNPWRFSFDREAGVLYIGDVGQNRWEEINAVPVTEGGHNFGWNTMEGLECFGATSCNQNGLTLPVVTYGHDDGCSVTGGYVYRGQSIPALVGHYVYADYCAGWIRAFRLGESGVAGGNIELPVASPGRITSFGEDSQGELYVLTDDGRVLRLAPDA